MERRTELRPVGSLTDLACGEREYEGVGTPPDNMAMLHRMRVPRQSAPEQAHVTEALTDASSATALAWGSPKTFQKRMVSSAAALTTAVPSGDWAMCSTRAEWPVSSAILAIEGYFHRHSWFWA